MVNRDRILRSFGKISFVASSATFTPRYYQSVRLYGNVLTTAVSLETIHLRGDKFKIQHPRKPKKHLNGVLVHIAC